MSKVRRKPGAPAPPDPAQYPTQVMPQRPAYPEMGHAGTAVAGGWVARRDKKFTSLRSWVDYAERMLRSDPKLAGGWNMVSQTARVARFKWRAGNDTPRAIAAAEYANEAWTRRMRVAWEEQLEFLLDYLPIGVRYAEEVYYTAGGRVWLSHYADREPIAHDQWLRAADGSFSGVRQLRMVGQSGCDIPASKLLVLWHKRRGDNYDGEGLLRPCSMLTDVADHTLDCLAIGMDRWASPTPIITVDRQMGLDSGYDDETITSMVTKARAEARAYVSHQSSSLEQTPFVTLGVYGGAGSMDVKGPLDVLQYANQARLSAFLAHLMELGLGESGSRSIGMVHQAMLQRALTNVLDYICGRVGGVPGPGRGTMGRLCRWNFPGITDDELPVMTHSGLDHNALAEAVPHLNALISAGALTPTDRLERELLDRFGLGWDPDAARPVAARLAMRGNEGRPQDDGAEVPADAAPIAVAAEVEASDAAAVADVTADADAESAAVKALALNGAQVEAAKGIVLSVGTGELPKSAAAAMLQTFFNIPADVVASLLASVVEGANAQADDAQEPTHA